MGKMIQEVIETPLKIINVDDGNVMHAIKNIDQGFLEFGEAYFSIVNPGKIKAWKRHRQMICNFVVPYGEIKVVLFDERDQQNNIFHEIILSTNNYIRLTIPPMIWIAFQGLSEEESILLNIASIVHDPEETDNKLIEEIEYDWSLNK